MKLIERVGLRHAVFQAGMGGGIATSTLAGAVSRAGGLGTVGMLDTPAFVRELRATREIAVDAPIAANVLVPFARRSHAVACIEAGVSAVVLFAGFSASLVEHLRAAGVWVAQQVGTPGQARRAIAHGVDAVIAQGREAGGHLLGERDTATAVRAVVGVAGDVPVLAAGGVATAEDVARLKAAGAAGVVAGTRFLLSEESRAHPEYLRRVLDAERTIETTLFSFGWNLRHRVVPNAATERWCGPDGSGPAVARAVGRATAPLNRALPMRLGARLLRTQRVGIPLFSPTPPTRGAPDRTVDVAPLYAGQSALRIDGILPAASIVSELAAGLA